MAEKIKAQPTSSGSEGTAFVAQAVSPTAERISTEAMRLETDAGTHSNDLK